jgi:hypothetical protein
MSDARQGGGKLGFLDALGRIFRAKPEAAPPATPQATSSFAKIEADFDAAIRKLNERIEEQRRAAGPTTAASPGSAPAAETAADRARRRDTAHREIREDIEKMHSRLGTGLSAADLDAISAYLKEIAATSAAGRGSHELLPRARHAIAQKLCAEAGGLAVAQLLVVLQRQGLDWPDPTHHRSTATPEEVERSRRRRLADTRESFLALDLEKLADRVLGIVRGWGGDYPDRGSPLWEESVLEGVGAAIRGRLIREYVELLEGDRDALLSRIEGAIGKEFAALQSALAGGVRSVEQANLAVASALGVLDEVVPEIAWQTVCSKAPKS